MTGVRERQVLPGKTFEVQWGSERFAGVSFEEQFTPIDAAAKPVLRIRSGDTVEVGTLYQDAAVPARLLVDDLFGKHFLIVGTTGCGKSSALSCILQSLLPDYREARVVVLDRSTGETFSEDIGDANPVAVYVPGIHAHGWEALTDCVFAYLVTEEYDAADPDEHGICWADPRVKHLWSTESPIISPRDAAACS